MTKSTLKHCLQCKDTLKGRADKKFCSTDCRTGYHNLLNKDVSKFMTNINNLLRKNHRILASFNHNGKAKVTKAQLLDEGFKFAYHTNEYVTRAGKVYFFCYDQGYIEYEPGHFALVIKHEYVE